jgi:RNA polymerase sigma-70 factor (ECF subfamily)
LVRATGGEESAWQRLVDLYGPIVAYWAGEAGVSRNDVEDITQIVFLRVHRALDRFQHGQEGQTFRGWLRVITRHCVNDHWRKRRVQVHAIGGTDAAEQLADVTGQDESLSLSASSESTAESDDKSVQMLASRALKLIETDFEGATYQAFVHYVMDNLSPKEVSAKLNISTASVYQAKTRVLARVREEFGDLLD